MSVTRDSYRFDRQISTRGKARAMTAVRRRTTDPERYLGLAAQDSAPLSETRFTTFMGPNRTEFVDFTHVDRSQGSRSSKPPTFRKARRDRVASDAQRLLDELAGRSPARAQSEEPPEPTPKKQSWATWLRGSDNVAIRCSLFVEEDADGDTAAAAPKEEQHRPAARLRCEWCDGSTSRDWSKVKPVVGTVDLSTARLVTRPTGLTPPEAIVKDEALDVILIVPNVGDKPSVRRVMRFDSAVEHDEWVKELQPVMLAVDQPDDTGAAAAAQEKEVEEESTSSGDEEEEEEEEEVDPSLPAALSGPGQVLDGAVDSGELQRRKMSLAADKAAPLQIFATTGEADAADEKEQTPEASVAMAEARLLRCPTQDNHRAADGSAGTDLLLFYKLTDDGADVRTLVRLESRESHDAWVAELSKRVAAVDDAKDLEPLRDPTPPPAKTEEPAEAEPEEAKSRSLEEDDSPQLITGFMEKFAVGKSSTGAKNWKRRWFELAAVKSALLTYQEKEGKKTLGKVPVNADSTRLVQNPTAATHAEAKAGAGTDIVIVFAEDGKEFKLLLRCDSAADHDRWVGELRKRIKAVDEPRDL